MSRMIPNLILGSTSKYKAQLLHEAGFRFQVEDSEVDELAWHEITVAETVRVLAIKKAEAVMQRHRGEVVVIITADVAGELDGKFLGKPDNLEHAKQMIASYSGRAVSIWCGTSVAWANTGEIKTNVVEAVVEFNALTAEQIDNYIAEKNPIDKGGAIAIEEIEQRGFVKRVTGEYAAIIGLSLDFIQGML